MTALFKSKEELKGFVLDVIETSPLSGRVDKLTARVDELHEVLKEDRAAGEERDLKTPLRGRPKRIREIETEE